MTDLDLVRLRAFLATVELGTVTAAAEQLGIAQPAVSRHLATLERQLGLTLFERGGRRLVLTAGGEELARLVGDLLGHVERVRESARGLAAGGAVRLRVAAPEATLTEVVAPFTATLGPEQPLLLMRAVPGTADPSPVLDRVDLMISLGAPSSDLVTRELGRVPLQAQVSPDHPWARRRRKRVDLADLAREPLLHQTRDNASRLLVEAALVERGLTTRVVAEQSLETAVQALAAGGHGVAVVTQFPRFGLHPCRIVDRRRELAVTLHAAWRADHYAAAEIGTLVDGMAAYLVQVLARLPAA